MKLAIIDLDGVVANVDARFQRAELAKEQWLMERQQGLPYAVNDFTEKEATNVYWRAVFNPEYVPMDVLIDGVKEALDEIEQEYRIMFLTSRPESMREATNLWLVQRNVYQNEANGANRLMVMKAPAFQYTKTTVWKAGMVQTLEALYSATDLLIVDDEQANINEHLKYFSAVLAREICKSLGEAVGRLNGTWVEPDPFLPDFGEEE